MEVISHNRRSAPANNGAVRLEVAGGKGRVRGRVEGACGSISRPAPLYRGTSRPLRWKRGLSRGPAAELAGGDGVRPAPAARGRCGHGYGFYTDAMGIRIMWSSSASRSDMAARRRSRRPISP
jgi:hypothetical protein